MDIGDTFIKMASDISEIKQAVKSLENYTVQKNNKRNYQEAKAFIYSVVGATVVALSLIL